MPGKGKSKRSRSPHRPRRRWWHWPARAGALAAAVLVLLYATLPWWAPERWVAETIARQLSRQAGVPVTVGRVDLSWADGVTVSDLRVGNEPAFGKGQLLSVGRVRCDLAPLTMLAGKPLEWMELSRIELHAVIDEAGRANLAPLSRIIIEPFPRRLVVRQAAAILRLPREQQRLRLDVSDLQYRVGRLTSFGRVTMSAMLAQDDGGAPVTLVASTSRRDPVATGSFRFARLDISHLRLPQLLGLPLKHLRGIGSGQMKCRVTSDGTVEALLFSIRVKDLDAQPKTGPTLPVIAEAEVSVSARYDWYTKRFQMDGFRLRLPGANIRGRGRVHSAVLTGGWEGVESLEVTGTVNPATLAALLSGGRARLPGRLSIDGDVKLALSLRGDESQLSSSLLLDATAARLKVGDRQAKPPGRKLTLRLQGSLEKLTWRFTMDRTELWIGSNRFVGAGAMQNVRRAAGKWFRADRSVAPATVLDDLAASDWHGSCEVSDLEALRDLLGWAPLDRARLTGKLTGEWSVKHTGKVLLRGSLRAGADVQLSLGDWFAKPAGKPLTLEASGDVAAGTPRLSRFRLWAGVGESGVRIDEGRLTFSAGGAAGRLSATVQGRFGIEGAEAILACFPKAGRWKPRLAGSADGRLAAMIAPGFRRIHVEANAARLQLALGDVFAKAAGQPADVALDFRFDESLPAQRRNRLELRVDLGSADLEADANFAAAAAKPWVRCSVRVSVTDADWLGQRCPALRRALRRYQVRGAMNVAARCRLSEGVLAGEVRCDGDDLEFVLPAVGGRKARGSALRLRLAGRVGNGEAVIDTLSLDVGRSSANLAGTIRAAKAGKPLPRGVYWPPPGVAGVDLTVRARLTPDAAVKALLPALAERLERYAAGGVLRVEMGVRDGADGGIDVAGEFDASDLAFAVEDTFRKPGKAPATGRFELSLPADLKQLRLRDLFVNAGKCQLRASASVPLLGQSEATARVALNAPDLRAACAYLPKLRQCQPTGGVFLEADYRSRGPDHVFDNVTIVARDVRATIRGKKVRLNGAVKLAGAEFVGGTLVAGKVATESLEWAVGDSHGFIVADLAVAPGRPAGRVAALCTRLDTPELERWAMPETKSYSTAPMTAAERSALGARADVLIGRLKEVLGEADLQLRLEARQLRYFDSAVKAFYVVQGVAGSAAVKGGVVNVDFACGLNGGPVQYRYGLDLKQDAPRVSMQCRLDRLLAKENIIMQLAQEFPGNRVLGTFSRRTEGTFLLRDAVMSALDGRHRLIVAGPAETVANDGLIRGRAAPKFITRIFPGLNLTTYRYRRMTAFAEYLPDGSAENDMIFSGAIYDIYIQGTTDRDRIGRYEIGVLLLASPQSPETLHQLRQGRIPILKFKARIENGRFWDEQVAYARPDEAAYKIFLENNIFYRLWRASRKGRRGAPSVIQPTGPAAGPQAKEQPSRSPPPDEP